MNTTSDFKIINEKLVVASATDRERAEIIQSLGAVDNKYASELAKYLESDAGAATLFLENYRKKYTAQLRADAGLWQKVLIDEEHYLNSLAE